jgi:hypothetical protein
MKLNSPVIFLCFKSYALWRVPSSRATPSGAFLLQGLGLLSRSFFKGKAYFPGPSSMARPPIPVLLQGLGLLSRSFFKG